MDPTAASALQAQAQLQEYVNGRLRVFAIAFAAEAAPHLSAEQAAALAEQIIQQQQAVPHAPSLLTRAGSSYGPPRLVFKHDCLALGCRSIECLLCAFNPERTCERNFQKKYLVGDVLRARCGAQIRVELVDQQGRLLTDSPYSNCEYEAVLVDGTAFKDRGGEDRQLCDEEFRACAKPRNAKEEILLCYKASAGSVRRQVRLTLQNGAALLPDMQVTDSSEALLSGRRPPFRLVLWLSSEALGDGSARARGAAAGYGNLPPQPQLSAAVRYAVSDDFVVATRRVKQANKADIPLVDDPVSKIEHIGRETVRKLSDMRLAAVEAGVDVQMVDDHMARIETVGQFQALVRSADTDTQLRKALQAMLKLSKEKWDEAAAHAMTAVVPDFRRRVWYPPTSQSENPCKIGLVFGCKYGAVQLKDAVGLVQQSAADGTTKVMAEDELDPTSLDIVRELKAKAVQRWAELHHPGWGIFKEPDATDALEKAFKAAAAAVASSAAASAAVQQQQQQQHHHHRLAAVYSSGGTSNGLTTSASAAAGSAAATIDDDEAAAAVAAAATLAAGALAGGRPASVGLKRSASLAGLDRAASAALPVPLPGPLHSRSLMPHAAGGFRGDTAAAAAAAAGEAASRDYSVFQYAAAAAADDAGGLAASGGTDAHAVPAGQAKVGSSNLAASGSLLTSDSIRRLLLAGAGAGAAAAAGSEQANGQSDFGSHFTDVNTAAAAAVAAAIAAFAAGCAGASGSAGGAAAADGAGGAEASSRQPQSGLLQAAESGAGSADHQSEQDIAPPGTYNSNNGWRHPAHPDTNTASTAYEQQQQQQQQQQREWQRQQQAESAGRAASTGGAAAIAAAVAAAAAGDSEPAAAPVAAFT